MPMLSAIQLEVSTLVTSPCASVWKPLMLAPMVIAMTTVTATAGMMQAMIMPTISGPTSLVNRPHASRNTLPRSISSSFFLFLVADAAGQPPRCEGVAARPMAASTMAPCPSAWKYMLIT